MKCLCDLEDEQLSDRWDFAADSRRFQGPLTPRMYDQGRETGSSPTLIRHQRSTPPSSSSPASTSTPKKILTSASWSLNITVSVILVLIVMGCATLTAAAPAPADTRTAATNRAVASASAAPHQGKVGPSAPSGGTSNGRQLSPQAGYNRIKRSASPYFTYGGYPTDVGGSGYPPYWVGRKSWNYSKFGDSGNIPFTVRIMLDALSTHTRPIVDVG